MRAMAQGLDRDSELLEIQAVAQVRNPLLAAGIGLLTGGPLGLAASLLAYQKLHGQWLRWALVGLLTAPPLAYGQLFAFNSWQEARNPYAEAERTDSANSISDADQAARACALAMRQSDADPSIRNPMDGTHLFCDRSFPTTVIVTSRRFTPLHQGRSYGGITLEPGTTAIQWLVSPAGSLVCQAVQHNHWLIDWAGTDTNIGRRTLYRRCTDNLRREALTGFSRSAHQLGLRDYCAEERALLARDQLRARR